ncbi:MAG: glutathione S-transferase [Planctomycetota bacterium]
MSEQPPVLYSFRRCPYAMRARMALAASRQPIELREVELRDRPAELYAASAKGTVPVLVLPDGEVIDESLDVMRWALGQRDPLAWLPASEDRRADCEALIAQNDGVFKHHLDRYKYATRYQEEGVDESEHRAAGAVILRELDGRLCRNEFLLGPEFTMTDAAIAPFVRQYALTDRSWFDAQEWTALRAWLDAFTSSQRFLAVMQKYRLWQPANEDPLLVCWN